MLTISDFPAHVRLMLLTARSRPRASEIEQIRELVGGQGPALDWQGFLAVTEHHRVSPLIYETLNQIRPEGLPEFVRDELQRRARMNAFEALNSVRKMEQIVARFAVAGIELSPLKGVALSQLLYGNPNMRHVGDLDLLTEPLRLPEQMALFAELGYTLINPRSRMTPNRLASYVHFWKDFTFRSGDGRTEVDLHWRLFNNRFHAANRLLKEASYTNVTVFGITMRVFSLEDQFLYCAAHGAFDSWTYLKTLVDLSGFLRLLSAAELDRALERAAQLGLLAQVSGAIHLANDWMGTEILSPRLLSPEEATARRSREHTTKMLLVQDFKPDRSYSSPAQWLRLELQLVPGVRSLAEVAQRFVWRPRVWTTVDLPDELFWFYPVLGLLLPPRFYSVEE